MVFMTDSGKTEGEFELYIVHSIKMWNLAILENNISFPCAHIASIYTIEINLTFILMKSCILF